jgi:hypothetical protein
MGERLVGDATVREDRSRESGALSILCMLSGMDDGWCDVVTVVVAAAAVGYDKRDGSAVVQRLQKVAILGKERTTEAGECELEELPAKNHEQLMPALTTDALWKRMDWHFGCEPFNTTCVTEDIRESETRNWVERESEDPHICK